MDGGEETQGHGGNETEKSNATTTETTASKASKPRETGEEEY